MAKAKVGELPCPKCKEPIQAAASRCRHCSYDLTPAEVEQRVKQYNQGQALGIGCLVVLGALFFVTFCTGSDRNSSSDSARQQSASAEDRRNGFHCLSGWDGSHREFTEKLKAQLRDPDSFEHIETRVTPEKNGSHGIIMEYRARNGFGGMNVSTAIGTYDHYTCKASDPVTSG